nr:PREDICTED: uncharacterized protein LOC105272113 [Fopius arisanus]
MAVCDNNYKFTLVDIGAYGSHNDAGVFSRSEFGKALRDQTLELPERVAKLPGSEVATPCFFVGDDAFRLTKNLVKPYADRNLTHVQKIFNYRLSRARRTIENAFGMLASRWRVFRKPICMNPATVDKIVMACVCLHNFLKTTNDALSPHDPSYCPPDFVDSESENGQLVPGECRTELREGFEGLAASSAHRATRDAYNQRDVLANYFLTPEGEIPWQHAYIRRGFHSDDTPDN